MKHALLCTALLLCANSIAAEKIASCGAHCTALKNTFLKPALMAKAKDPCATVESAEAYLETGTSVDFEDKDGNTPLLLAAMSDNAKFVEFFIHNGAAIEHKNKAGKTALILAAEKQRFEAARVLIKHKADVNALDNGKWTPLLYAAQSGNVIMVELLLDYGANLWAQNERGSTALHCAAKSGSLPVVKTLVERTKEIAPNKINTFINAASNSGTTPLIYAASWGHNEIVKYLISCGADVNALATDGLSATDALHAAVYWDNATTVEILLENGANINAKDALGKTAFERALQKQYESVAQVLINHGAHKRHEAEHADWTRYTSNPEFRKTIEGLIKEYHRAKQHQEL